MGLSFLPSALQAGTMQNEEALSLVRTTAELERLGTSKKTLARRVARGQMVALRRGVYISSEDLTGRGARDLVLIDHVAVLKTSTDGVLSHLSAALWWGSWTNSLPGRVELSYTGSNGNTRHGVTAHKRRKLLAHFTQRRDGYPVTTPLQTVVDCARSLPLLDALMIADYMLSRNLADRKELVAELLQVSGRGTRTCRLVAERMSALAGSPAETMARNLFYEWKLELPREQFGIRTRSGNLYYADFAWVEQKLILEVDGMVKYSGEYGDPREVVAREHWRSKQLEQLGWRVLRSTVDEMTNVPGLLYDRLLKAGIPHSA